MKKLMAITALILLSACTGELKSKTGSTDSSFSVSGVASAGPINSGTVTAYAINSDGSEGSALGSTTSDASGNFTLKISGSSGAVLLVVMGGSYVEEASGETVSLGNAKMRTTLPLMADQQKVAVTPVTEIAAQSALSSIATNPTASISSIIKDSNTKVAAAMGLNDITAPPANPTMPASNATNSEAAQYAVVLASLSQLAKTAGTANGTTINSLDVAQALATSFTYNGAFHSSVGTADVPVPNSSGVTVSLSSILGGANQFDSAMQAARTSVVQNMPTGFNDTAVVPTVNFVTAPSAPAGAVAVNLPSAPAVLPWASPTLSGPPALPGSVVPTSPLSYIGATQISFISTPVWKAGAPLPANLDYLAYTTLKDGRNLVTSEGTSRLYNPVQNSWSESGAVHSPGFSTMTCLNDGRALLMGGATDGGTTEISDVQIYDPTKNQWTTVAPLPEASAWVSSTVLANGNVLITGATLPAIFNGTSWTQTPATGLLRSGNALVTLNDGRALAFGGYTMGGNPTNTAEFYNPSSNTWTTAGSFANASAEVKAVVLKNGNVLGTGGTSYTGAFAFSTSELFDVKTNAWVAIPNMAHARYRHQMVVLPDGDAMVSGGTDDDIYDVAETEIFSASTSTWSTGPALHVGRSYHVMSVNPEGVVIVQGGFKGGSTWEASTEIFDMYPTKVALTVSGGTAPYSYSVVSGSGFVRGSTFYTRRSGSVQIRAVDSQIVRRLSV